MLLCSAFLSSYCFVLYVQLFQRHQFQSVFINPKHITMADTQILL